MAVTCRKVGAVREPPLRACICQRVLFTTFIDNVGSRQARDYSVRDTPDGSLLPDRDDRNYKAGGICRRQCLEVVPATEA